MAKLRIADYHMTVRISHLLADTKYLGHEVTVKGWVRSKRTSSDIAFIAVNDGSSFHSIQVVADTSLPNFESEVTQLTKDCSVVVHGKLVESPAKGQAYEIHPTSIEVIGWVEDPETYPVSPKRHSMEHLRENAHLRVRTNLIGAVARVRNTLSQAIHKFFQDDGFIWLHTPIITANDCEGAGEMFRISTLDIANFPKLDDGSPDYSKDFFGREAHLTVSGQLNAETYALGMSKVYTFGPTFRAENSNTRRHLAEFWMVEPEIAFANLEDDIVLAERFLKFIFKTLLEERTDDMEFFNKFVQKGVIERLENFIQSPFQRLDYSDAIPLLQKANTTFEYEPHWGIDLQSEHEKYLTDQVFNAPVVVTNYPKDIKAFYMRLNDDGKTVAAMDVLAPGIGEIIGGSQREDRLSILDRRISEMNLPANDYWWYRDLRRYGSTPHAGFGLGFERAILYATGIENIRDVIPFPRTPRNADF